MMTKTVSMSLKEDVAKLMGSLFGKDTEKLFKEYYDEQHPEELLKAAKDMITKLLGSDIAHRYCQEMIKKHPEIKRFKAICENEAK